MVDQIRTVLTVNRSEAGGKISPDDYNRLALEATTKLWEADFDLDEFLQTSFVAIENNEVNWDSVRPAVYDVLVGRVSLFAMDCTQYEGYEREMAVLRQYPPKMRAFLRKCLYDEVSHVVGSDAYTDAEAWHPRLTTSLIMSILA